jgi:Amt family ammonium transporter
MFAGVTQVIVVGGAAERARIAPVMLWLFLWATIVYCPVANWVWNANGWIYQMGDLDVRSPFLFSFSPSAFRRCPAYSN